MCAFAIKSLWKQRQKSAINYCCNYVNVIQIGDNAQHSVTNLMHGRGGMDRRHGAFGLKKSLFNQMIFFCLRFNPCSCSSLGFMLCWHAVVKQAWCPALMRCFAFTLLSWTSQDALPFPLQVKCVPGHHNNCLKWMYLGACLHPRCVLQPSVNRISVLYNLMLATLSG